MAIRLRGAVAACVGALALSLGVSGAVARLPPLRRTTRPRRSSASASTPSPRRSWAGTRVTATTPAPPCRCRWTTTAPGGHDRAGPAPAPGAQARQEDRHPLRQSRRAGRFGHRFAYFAPYFLSEDLLDRFDVVGFDPRGTTSATTSSASPAMPHRRPSSMTSTRSSSRSARSRRPRYIAASKKYGKACSTTGKPLSASMSTAQVARDMDVLRRAVGDKQLTYLGFSYGSYLGQVYANLFPDRVRALVMDGVLDPVRWAGTGPTRNDPDVEPAPVGRRLSKGAAGRSSSSATRPAERSAPSLPVIP